MTKLVRFFYLFALFGLLSCSKVEKKIQLSGHTMGTTYHIVVVNAENHPAIGPESLKKAIDGLLIDINKQMSTYQKDSEISRFNQYKKNDWFSVSKDFAFVVANAQKVSQKTRGAFDISVSPLVELWGFGAKTQYNIPSNEQIGKLLSNVGYQHLAVRFQPSALKKDKAAIKIDLSAIAKGFAVDKVGAYLAQQGFNHYLVEIGGEIKAKGKNASNQAWQVAIEQPGQAHATANKVISIIDSGLATSGDYRNYYIKDGKRFSHTIDPKTGKPITHKLASVTIIHDSSMIADAYATAVMVMGEKQGKEFIINNKIKANMIIRGDKGFISWSNQLD